MPVFNKKTNTLEQTQYKYMIQDVAEPNLFREIYSYNEQTGENHAYLKAF